MVRGVGATIAPAPAPSTAAPIIVWPPPPAPTLTPERLLQAASAAPTMVQLKATPLLPDATPAPPAPQVALLSPPAIAAGELPATITVEGAFPSAVREALLRGPDGTTLFAEARQVAANILMLGLPSLDSLAAESITYTLELDGYAFPGATLVVQNSYPRVVLAGISADYYYTGALVAKGNALYAPLRRTVDGREAILGLLKQTDEVEVLREDLGNVSYVRVTRSADPELRGATGWLPTWLTDPTRAPARPAPMLPGPAVLGSIADLTTDRAAICGTRAESLIWGEVYRGDGSAIVGATIEATSSDGAITHSAVTGDDGLFQIANLSCASWNVRVRDMPAVSLTQTAPVTVRDLNGGAGSQVRLSFQYVEPAAGAPFAGMPAPDGMHSVLLQGAPSMTAAAIDAVLARYGSPATGQGDVFYRLGLAYGVDPAYALAFFIHESQAATDPGWSGLKPDGSTTHNVGNIVCAGYPTCYGRFRDYPSWQEGIEGWYRLIRRDYVERRGLDTVERIVPVYAPAFDGNAPLSYIAAVNRLVARWRAMN